MIASAGSATQPRFIVGRPPMQTWSHTSVTTRISLGHFNQLVEYPSHAGFIEALDSGVLIALAGLDAPRCAASRNCGRNRSSEQIGFFARHRQQRIMAQPGVIVEILIPQRQTIEPLGQQLGHRMIDPARVPLAVEAVRQQAGNPQRLIHLPQQQHAPIGRVGAAGEIGHHGVAPSLGTIMFALYSLSLKERCVEFSFGSMRSSLLTHSPL